MPQRHHVAGESAPCGIRNGGVCGDSGGPQLPDVPSGKLCPLVAAGTSVDDVPLLRLPLPGLLSVSELLQMCVYVPWVHPSG